MRQWFEQYVTVNFGGLEALGRRLAAGEWATPDWRMPVYPDDDARYVEYIGVANAINYAFGDLASGAKYAVEVDGVTWSGAMGMVAALTRAGCEGVDMCDASTLQALRLADVTHLFRPAEGAATLPMLAQRTTMLNSVGATLASGSFAEMVAHTGYDAGALIETLATTVAAYADDRWYHPRSKEQLIFDKRARLYAVMYEGRARASGGKLPTLTNLEAVGPIIDYQVPRALRAEKVLSYSPALATSIDMGQLLAVGSEAELALRCAGEAATNVLLEMVNAYKAEPVTMVELDYVLWLTGRAAKGQPHLCATTAY